MTRLAACLAVAVVSALPAFGQVAPSAAAKRLVGTVTEALFDTLVRADFTAERGFMADSLAAQANLANWTSLRRGLIGELSGTPRYQPHALTWYQTDRLLAAVDFWGKAATPDTYVCGFVLWELPQPDVAGFSRLEQNVVPVRVMQKMDKAQAAQLMADWHCPAALIETVLQVKLR